MLTSLLLLKTAFVTNRKTCRKCGHEIPEIQHECLINIILPGLRRTYRSRLSSQSSWSWHRQPDHLFELLIRAQRMVLRKSQCQNFPYRANNGGLINWQCMKHVPDGSHMYMFAEYLSDKSSLRCDMTYKQLPRLSSCSPKNQ